VHSAKKILQNMDKTIITKAMLTSLQLHEGKNASHATSAFESHGYLDTSKS
jgi:hypothetical protein